MNLSFNKVSRAGLDAASVATSVGFTAAKLGTRLAVSSPSSPNPLSTMAHRGAIKFSITRGITTTAAGLTGSVLDYGLFGGRTSAGPVLSSAVASTLSVMEQITLAPILLSESLTSTSFTVAIGSLDLVSAIMPGEEATFSLRSFIQLVRREWTDPVARHFLPEKRYSVLQVTKALVAWATLQDLTHGWQEKEWSPYLKGIDLQRSSPFNVDDPHQPSTYEAPALRVTADVVFPGSKGQIVSADIGEAGADGAQDPCASRLATNVELYLAFRRLSKLVLAGYGGATLLLFGLSPNDFASSKPSTGGEANLAEAVDASERDPSPGTPCATQYSWWNLLLGRHDHDIFHGHARSSLDTQLDAVNGVEPQMPRYWVLSDHRRKQVVLVIRGKDRAAFQFKIITQSLGTQARCL